MKNYREPKCCGNCIFSSFANGVPADYPGLCRADDDSEDRPSWPTPDDSPDGESPTGYYKWEQEHMIAVNGVCDLHEYGRLHEMPEHRRNAGEGR